MLRENKTINMNAVNDNKISNNKEPAFIDTINNPLHFQHTFTEIVERSITMGITFFNEGRRQEIKLQNMDKIQNSYKELAVLHQKTKEKANECSKRHNEIDFLYVQIKTLNQKIKHQLEKTLAMREKVESDNMSDNKKIKKYREINKFLDRTEKMMDNRDKLTIKVENMTEDLEKMVCETQQMLEVIALETDRLDKELNNL